MAPADDVHGRAAHLIRLHGLDMPYGNRSITAVKNWPFGAPQNNDFHYSNSSPKSLTRHTHTLGRKLVPNSTQSSSHRQLFKSRMCVDFYFWFCLDSLVNSADWGGSVNTKGVAREGGSSSGRDRVLINNQTPPALTPATPWQTHKQQKNPKWQPNN